MTKKEEKLLEYKKMLEIDAYTILAIEERTGENIGNCLQGNLSGMVKILEESLKDNKNKNLAEKKANVNKFLKDFLTYKENDINDLFFLILEVIQEEGFLPKKINIKKLKTTTVALENEMIEETAKQMETI